MYVYVHVPVIGDAHGCGRRCPLSTGVEGRAGGGRGLMGGMGVVIP